MRKKRIRVKACSLDSLEKPRVSGKMLAV
jgi:hypothetical protein